MLSPSAVQSSHQAHVEQPQIPPTALFWGILSLQCQNSSQLQFCNPFTARELQQSPKQQILTQNKAEWQHKPLFLRAYRTSEAEQGIPAPIGILPTFSQAPNMGMPQSPEPSTALLSNKSLCPRAPAARKSQQDTDIVLLRSLRQHKTCVDPDILP